MTDYWPTLHDLAGFGGVAAALLVFLALGMAAARRQPPEIQIVAGWGIACLVLTLWGAALPYDLRWPVAALAAIGAASLWFHRKELGETTVLLRAALIAAPLLLVLLSLQPSQIDTWLNLLPNLSYLYDHGVLPTAARPPNHSFLPAAPYDTQFAGFIASLVAGQLADNALAWFSIALQLVAAVLLARVIAGDGRRIPPWWALAGGVLAAILSNPGFLPRVFLASYGEAPLAVTSLFAVWLAAEAIDDLARGVKRPAALVPLALVLAAMLNIKQSGIGSVLAVGIAALALVAIHPQVPKQRGVSSLLGALVPALLLYGLWRWFVLTEIPNGELKTLPLHEWNFALLPRILGGIAYAISQKGFYFAFLVAVLIAGAIVARREAWSRRACLLFLVGGTTILFVGFLLVTYVAHFEAATAADAHSFFRYMTQLSLVLVLGAIVALRPWAARWLARAPTAATWIGRGAIAAALIVPLVATPLLRPDLDTPQPELRRLADEVKSVLPPDARLALLVPGDPDDAAGSMLRGLLYDVPPRRPRLDIRTESKVDAATLGNVAQAGYVFALISCAPTELNLASSHAAALLKFGAGRWQPVAVWPWSDDLAARHFAGIPRAALCAQ